MNSETRSANGIIAILNDSSSLKAAAVGLFLIISAILFWFAHAQQYGQYILPGILGMIIVPVIIRYPKAWIYSIALFNIIFFRASEKGVSALDIITGLYYVGTLFGWFFWKIAVQREKIVQNTADWAILFFYIGLILLNFPLALLNGVTVLSWAREYVLYSTILFFFPIRYYLKNKRDLILLFITYAIVLVALDFYQFYQYYSGAFAELTYAYQLGYSVRSNQPIFTAAGIFGILFTVYSRKISLQILLIIFTTLTISALILSFTRTFWVILLFEIILLFFFLEPRQKLRAGIYLGITSLIVGLLLALVFQENAKVMIKLINNRLESTTQGKQDISVLARLVEYEETLNRIQEQPLSGQGLGNKIRFYDILTKMTQKTHNIHNGYLFLVFRVGIPFALIFLFFLVYYFFKGIFLLFNPLSSFDRIVILGVTSSLLMIFVSSISAAIFFSRDSFFIIATSVALISIAERNYKANLIKKQDMG